ncbi:SRPBCC domain-containing protein [Dyadobacter fanqingshengii]|uniref:SRPBCC domain-containing protein n=1 Tax=Dyadobacter fanqingshengii TaxID=2906443 RepID=A0A9X1T9T2_9BACT|nr:SRPBCC domain-containing protein [Dyadobacter fanqingshengii]MCF0040294.1 SRPBCC domain-containing protein [Dyadobacter fanqingshengii]USJ37958.1 SRPBCC domain-containing protein [Dyadobacter fanqingshengii]
MDRTLIVNDQIQIEAPLSKVWEVLVAPKYIRQWDDLPSGFDDYYLEPGRIIEWTGITKLTVSESEPNAVLKLSLYVDKWELPPAAYDIAYTYRLSEEVDGVLLQLEIGDFGVLEDGQAYYDSSVEFAETALEKIKNLAENRL